MRAQASILHLDLDAFFAAVEQRDKPSLKGRAVIVGGLGGRGVVSTASYEARVHGVRSAMPMSEARRRAPYAAYLSGRFDAYHQSSRIVMALLAELSPKVEALSLDEAFVDLAAGGVDCSSSEALVELAETLRAELTVRTEGLTASVGIGTSKFMAKVASELAKPDGVRVIEPGTELDVISDMSVRAIPGVGPATHEKLQRLGLQTVRDLQNASEGELLRELGQSWGHGLRELAFARDDREVSSDRETKSISVEDTFEHDLRDRADLERILVADADLVCARVRRHGTFARTVTIKVRLGDFTTWTRSRTLAGGTDQPERVAAVAISLLRHLDLREGVRLLGLGLSGFTMAAQEELFDLEGPESKQVEGVDETTTERAGLEPVEHVGGPFGRRRGGGWSPGVEVEHDEHGRGWVWGAGHGRVTVRFETRHAPGGRVRSFAVDDPALHRAGLLPMTHEVPEARDDD
ncbi:DNA polymerase IV [Aestuariimicrobium ganziense]|uniref:DNA polymerase IV n=1 Tax=Aestuariimicrobium ganziense TaxID=2773677 RepID=UPI001940E4BB|nr:DNA polymerase IV [Aestuariimicrobium ganziense]